MLYIINVYLSNAKRRNSCLHCRHQFQQRRIALYGTADYWNRQVTEEGRVAAILLDRILPEVEKPARYTGNEWNMVVKPGEVLIGLRCVSRYLRSGDVPPWNKDTIPYHE